MKNVSYWTVVSFHHAVFTLYYVGQG